MTPALWVTLAAAIFTLVASIGGVYVLLKNNKDNLTQKLEEMALAHREEAEKTRNDERAENNKQANIIREELRGERNRLAEDVVKERARAEQVAEDARLERDEFRVEISLLQKTQREIDGERAQTKAFIDALNKKHAAEVDGYKRQLKDLQAKVNRMEARIKELEAGK